MQTFEITKPPFKILKGPEKSLGLLFFYKSFIDSLHKAYLSSKNFCDDESKPPISAYSSCLEYVMSRFVTEPDSYQVMATGDGTVEMHIYYSDKATLELVFDGNNVKTFFFDKSFNLAMGGPQEEK